MPQEVSDWFEKLDANKDNILTVNEANAYIKNWIMGEYGIKNPAQAMIEDVFREIDINGDKQISR